MITVTYTKNGVELKAFCTSARLSKTKKALKESEYTIIGEHETTQEELDELAIITAKPESITKKRFVGSAFILPSK